MKHLRRLLLVLLLCFAFGSIRAGDDEKVTAQICGFYQWYFHLVNTTPGDSDIKQHRKEFGRYLTAKFLHHIEHMSEGEGQEGDPFFLQPDWDPGWEKNIEVSHIKANRKGGVTAEVRLSGQEMPARRLKLTLMQEGGTYKIARVEVIGDETPDKPAEASPSPTP